MRNMLGTVALCCLTLSSCLHPGTANPPRRMALFEAQTGRYVLVVIRSGSAWLVQVYRGGMQESVRLAHMLDRRGVKIVPDYVLEFAVSPAGGGSAQSCVLEFRKESGIFFDGCCFRHPERIAQVVLDIGGGPNSNPITFSFPFSLVKQRLHRNTGAKESKIARNTDGYLAIIRLSLVPSAAGPSLM